MTYGNGDIRVGSFTTDLGKHIMFIDEGKPIPVGATDTFEVSKDYVPAIAIEFDSVESVDCFIQAAFLVRSRINGTYQSLQSTIERIMQQKARKVQEQIEKDLSAAIAGSKTMAQEGTTAAVDTAAYVQSGERVKLTRCGCPLCRSDRAEEQRKRIEQHRARPYPYFSPDFKRRGGMNYAYRIGEHYRSVHFYASDQMTGERKPEYSLVYLVDRSRPRYQRYDAIAQAMKRIGFAVPAYQPA